MKHAFAILYKIWMLLSFIVTFTFLFPIYLPTAFIPSLFPVCISVIRLHTRIMMFLLGIRFELKQLAKLPPPPYVICSNHTSFIDIPVIYFIFSDYFKFMAKRELIYVPFFNVFFLKMNITVNRKSRKDSHRAYVEASQTIKSGNGICIFPEGTISRHCPKMINFKNGAFKLAIEHQVPIVPVTLVNNWNILRDDSFFSPNARPGKSIAVIHESIPTQGMTEQNLETLKQQCFDVINTPLQPYLQKN